MAKTSIYTSEAAFYEEPIVCQETLDWAADGEPIEHIALDTSSIGQAFIPDPTLERRALSTGGRLNVEGVRNCEFPIGIKLHGTGVVTDVGDQVVVTRLGKILRHCMGGLHVGTSHTVVGGTTTVVQLDSVAGVARGCMVAFQDTTAALPGNVGKLHPRRVIDIDDGDPKTVTLSEALPFVPVSGDLAHGCLTAYPKESVLEDAVTGPSGNKTWSWFIKKHRTDTNMQWVVLGSVASFEVQGLDRGQLPSLNLKVMGGNFRHGGADGLTVPTFASPPAGNAQLSMGRDFVYNFGNYTTTTIAGQDCNKCAFTVGFERTPVETVTEKVHLFEGRASYSFKPAPSKVAATFVEYTDDYYQSLAQKEMNRVTLYQPGDGSGAGKMWCIHCPKMQISTTPKRADTNDVNGVSIELQTMEPDNVVDGGADIDLELATFVIAIA